MHLPARSRRLSAVPAIVAALLAIETSMAACTTPPSPPPTPAPAGEAAGTVPSAVAQPGASTPTGSGSALAPSVATATALVAARLPELERIVGAAGTEDGQFTLPADVAVDATGNLYVADAGGVQKLDAEGAFLSRIGAGELLTAQGGLAVAPDGRLYVTGFDALVRVYGPDGAALGHLGEEGSEPGKLRKPVDVAVGPDGRVYVADAGNARVEVFDAEGAHVLTIGGQEASRAPFTTPRTVAIDAEGRVLVGVGDDYLIGRYGADGTYLDAFGEAHADENAWRVGGLAVDDTGAVFVSQTLSGRIQSYDAVGSALEWEMGTSGAGQEDLSSPLGLAVAGGRLYVADQGNHRVKVYRLRR